MINTYNESSLHAELKAKCAAAVGGETEVKVDGYICDVVSGKQIYEIQTANLSKLKDKIKSLIGGHRITVVFPVAESTIIQTETPSGEILSRRKSPKKENVYRIFNEITGLLPFFDNPNFCIKTLFINQKIVRVKTEKPVQLANKSRRFKKDWYTKDKELVSINAEAGISTAKDLSDLLAQAIDTSQEFCAADLEKSAAKKYARLVIWVLKKLEVVEETKTEARRKYYKLKTP